jgi:hypothetical protein
LLLTARNERARWRGTRLECPLASSIEDKNAALDPHRQPRCLLVRLHF